MKPPRLREGDTIGVVSPSWGGGAEYPHRVERGVEYLRSLGFRVNCRAVVDSSRERFEIVEAAVL